MHRMSRTRLSLRLPVVLSAVLFCATVAASSAQADPPRGPRCADPAHFVLVHGAWHGAWAWYKTAAQLEKRGHTVTTVNLPAHGIDRTPPESVTLQDYVDAVIDAIDEAGEPVILVGHSLAGIVISSVAEQRPESVEKLVYLSALLLPDGFSVFDLIAMAPDAPMVAQMIPEGNTLDINRDAAIDIFYNLSPPAEIKLAESLLVKDPLLPMVTPLSLSDEGFGSVPRYYIATTEDNAIPPDIQQYMYTLQPCEDVYTIDSDHSPFFSRPSRLTGILLRIAAR